MIYKNASMRRGRALRFAESLVASSPIGWALVSDGIILDENPSFIDLSWSHVQGWSLVSDRSFACRAPTGNRELRRLVIQRARLLRRRRSREQDDRIRVACGDRTLDVSLRWVTWKSGAGAVLVAVRDVSDLDRERREMHESYQKISQHVGPGAMAQTRVGVAHDLGNLFAALNLRLGLLAENPTCVREAGPNLEALQKIVQRATSLLTRLRKVVSGGSGDVRPLDVRKVVASAAEVARSRLCVKAMRRGMDSVEIACSIPDLPLVWGIEEDVEQALVSLLLNVADTMPSVGRMTINGEKVSGGVAVTIEDDGTGIRQSNLRKFLHPSLATKATDATNLRLSIAADLMVRTGGSVRAINRPHAGACFELRFLCATQPENSGTRSRRESPNGKVAPVFSMVRR